MCTVVHLGLAVTRASMRPGKPLDQRSRQSGYGLLFMLLAIAVLCVGSLVIATRWTQQIERQKEADLLRVGDAYAQAIISYYYSTPGPAKRFPKNFNELLEDSRFVNLRRHLRAAYPDPVTGSTDWGLVLAPDGGIMGVYSQSQKATWRRTAIELEHCKLSEAERYADWKFIAKIL